MASMYDADNDAIFGKNLNVYSPMTTTPDFRALLVELTKLQGHVLVECTEEWADVMDRARAALATPPPKPPTDTELDALEEKLWHEYKTCGYLGEEFMYDYSFKHALSDYRTVLEGWGR